MTFQLKALSLALMTATLVSACSVTPYTKEEKSKPLQDRPTSLVVDRSDTYMREVTPDETLLKRKVNLSGTLTLMDALRREIGDINVIPGDQNVKLDQTVKVFAQDMFLGDYLKYLESVTGYDFQLKGHVLTVRSFVEKQWNMAMFASKRNVKLKVGTTLTQTANASSSSSSSSSNNGGGDNNNEIAGTFNDDEWSIIVDGANQILGVKGGAGKTGDTDIQKPFVQAIRSVGTLSVGGPAARVKELGSFLNNIQTAGSRQININVQAYDVSLSDSRGSGIDWTKLANIDGAINGNPLGISITSDANANVVNNSALFTSNVTYKSSAIDAQAMFRFLSTYGDVELLNQPNVTVRNGTYAYISTGEEFSFVGEITRESQLGSGALGGVTTTQDVTAIKVDSVRVGVTLAVTPRLLDDGRIMLDIWPVISSQTGSDRFTVAGNNYDTPRIALNELSTEVITESGKPIQLGGFIRKSIEKNLQELPWKDRITNAIVNPLFHSEKKGLDRRELVLTVTPTVVEGV